MKIIFNKKEKKVIELFKQLQWVHNNLLSVDTEIQSLNQFSPPDKVEDLKLALNNYRIDEKLILDRINRIAM